MNSSGNYYPNPKKRVLASISAAEAAAASAAAAPVPSATPTAPQPNYHRSTLAAASETRRADGGMMATATIDDSSSGGDSDDNDDAATDPDADTIDEDDDDDDDDEDTDNATDSDGSRRRKRPRLDAAAARLDAALRGFDDEASPAKPQQQPPKFPQPQSMAPKPTAAIFSYGSTLSAEESSSDESTATSVASFNQSPAASSAGASQSAPNKPSASGGDSASAASAEFTGYSNISMLMMRKMGFIADQGLGKQGQGRTAPVEASEQRGRRGLGLRLDGLDRAAETFDATQEVVELHEPVEWMDSPASGDGAADALEDLSRDELESWLRTCCPPKRTLDDETRHVDAAVLTEVLSNKSIFDNLGANDMRQARTRSNPFETIRGAIFLNRAAVKMANMDAMFDFMFTNPVDERGQSLVRPDDLLYFADVCAGPGGFSEYVLWRKGWQCKGIGFTLRAENDFKLQDFFAGCPETFNPYYGAKADGNVFDPANIESLREHVLAETGDRGVHFMMADGGFSVEGEENIQEILSKQLYLCQCLVALGIVRERGHFVCKLFDLFTPFSAGLVYLMYRCFRRVSVVKPNTSRPANSERYLVCKWKRPGTEAVYRHLFEVNRTMWQQPKGAAAKDFQQLVDPDVLAADATFSDYLYNSNTRIGINQIAGLLKIAAYCRDNQLRETRQPEIRRECLRIWRIPDKMRKAPERKSSDQLLSELLDGWHGQQKFLLDGGRQLDSTSTLSECFPELSDWHFVAVDVVEPTVRQFRTMIMSKGGRDVLMLQPNGSWTALPELHVEITPNTLVYAEVVRELSGEGRSQTVTHALHLIDAIRLGGVDVRNKSLPERLRMCEKFALALNRPAGSQKEVQGRDGQTQSLAPIRCKRLWAMSDFGPFFERLTHYKLKDGNVRYGMQVRTNGGESGGGGGERTRFFVPRGLLFFNAKKPWLQRAFSRSQQKMYYVDPFRKATFFEDQIVDPTWINASFKSSFTGRRLWAWQQADQVSTRLEFERTGKLLYRVDMSAFIEGQLAKVTAASAAAAATTTTATDGVNVK